MFIEINEIVFLIHSIYGIKNIWGKNRSLKYVINVN